MMRWSISKGLDGVITDDPKKFMEVCKDWEKGKREIRISMKGKVMAAWINLMILIFGTIFYWKYGGIDKRKTKDDEKKVDAVADARRREKSLEGHDR